jgi:hypothetical protein
MAHTNTNILVHALSSTKDCQPWLDYDGFPDAARLGGLTKRGCHL